MGPYGCEEADTDTVLISIFEEGEEEADSTLTQSCDARQAEIAGVRPGMYEVRVEAITDNGLVTFAGSMTAVTPLKSMVLSCGAAASRHVYHLSTGLPFTFDIQSLTSSTVHCWGIYTHINRAGRDGGLHR